MTVMAMPEAPVYEKNGGSPWEDEIRLTGKSLFVELVSEPDGMETLANDQFGLGLGRKAKALFAIW